MSDIQMMILEQRMAVLKRFADKENKGSWKITLNYFFSQVGGCNFDTQKLPVCLPTFNKKCLDAKPVFMLLREVVVYQVIWNNKDITIRKLSTF